MIRVEEVSIKLGGHTLIEGLNFEFHVGEFCMILGPNGAGKTTLLRCLDGGLHVSHGQIEFEGRLLDQWSNHELAIRRGVLPQHSNLEFPFTAWDVVLMGRSPHATDEQTDHQIVRQALEYCHCQHLAKRAFPTLSGGEQQRVQMARVLAQVLGGNALGHRWLILDEPVSALDLSHQYFLFRVLRKLVRTGPIGIICSLHNLNLAAQFADRCLLLDHGQLVANGAPGAVLNETLLSRVFEIEMLVSPHPQDSDIPLIMPRIDGL